MRLPVRLASRSLLIFEDESGLEGVVAALSSAMTSAATPHLLIAWRDATGRATGVRARLRAWPLVVRESEATWGEPEDLERAATARDEANARWPALLARATAIDVNGGAEVRLARVLARRGQTFEARGWLATPANDSAVERERAALIEEMNARSRHVAGLTLRERVGAGPPAQAGRDGMVDDFVGVLQLCQDIEDERVALFRVGAYLRERLQAASVAFVVREGPSARTIAASGLDQTRLDAALTAIESGCSVARCADDGPAESAAPVRYAADVIGALWVRWSAGMPVSGSDASALLGVAAIAAAPSLRGALDRERPAPDAVVPELVGASQAIRAVREAVVRAARSPFPVLIEGESGVGKELVARAIHTGGARRDRRFSAINCAALVDDLVEAELFGHARGAFTGAQTDRAGLFEDASGGTLFLDEVAELGSRVQAKLLRTLQEGEVRRIGEAHTRRVDVRVVAATNRPLAAEVTSGRFRRDLWYRLDVIRIAIPPVRERLEDIPLLVRHAWGDLAARTGSRAVLSASAVAGLAAYDWPGNVRELQNVLASILVSAPRRGVLGPSILPAHVARAAALAPASTLEAARRQFETRFVRAALARANGRPSIAARELGLSRQGLAKVLVRLGLSESPASHRPHVE
jgi:DNA-binding NtrC family response regulator